jgi:hypothetical protein
MWKGPFSMSESDAGHLAVARNSMIAATRSRSRASPCLCASVRTSPCERSTVRPNSANDRNDHRWSPLSSLLGHLFIALHPSVPSPVG